MSAAIHYGCDRIGCEARAEVPVEEYDLPGATVDAATPEGWVWEYGAGGLDMVLHCPDHAGAEA